MFPFSKRCSLSMLLTLASVTVCLLSSLAAAEPSPAGNTAVAIAVGEMQLSLIPGGAPLPVSGTAAAVVAASGTSVPANHPPLVLNAAPQGLEVKTGGTRIVLAWEAYSGPAGSKIHYQLYRSENPLPANGPIGWPQPINRRPIANEYFLDSDETSRQGPQGNVRYYYALVAVDDQGNTSPPALIDAINVAELSSPTNLQAEAGDCQIKLIWTPAFSGGAVGLAGYAVYRANEAGELGAPVTTTAKDAAFFIDHGLPTEPLINGHEYFYTLFAQDVSGNRSRPSEQVAASPFKPAGSPQQVTATGKTDDMIEITWKAPAAGSYPIKGYNVYRATDKEELEGPINRTLVTSTRFTDSESNSTSKPILGHTYHYVVKTVDERDLEGQPSEKASAAALPPLEIPQTGLLSTAIPGLPPDSSLTISGRKKIDIGYTSVLPLNTTPGGTEERYPSLTSGLTKGFNLAQELQVRLEGKVGKKITVDVDYDDTKEEQRKISILYNGDPDEVVQEAAFGDILLDLPHTEFAGYNKNLFGAKLKVGLDRFRLYAIGAQTKGVSVTEKFKGNTALRTIDIQDINFVAFRYYYLTKDWPNQVNHPDLPAGYDSTQVNHGIVSGSVEIYVTNGVITADTVAVTINANSRLMFNRLSPGIDYTVDYERGIVTFTNTLARTYKVLVAYRYLDKDKVEHSVGYGLNGKMDFTPANITLPTNGKTSNTAHLIQDSYEATGAFEMMLMNRYALGYQNIYDPQNDQDFKIQVYTTGGQQLTLPQPSDQYSSEKIYEIDATFGTVEFKYDYPFAQSSSGSQFQHATYDFSSPSNDAYNPNINSTLGGVSTSNLANNYRIHVEYKNTITTFKLANYNVIQNSEVIKKDGLKLQRNTDYYIDYDTGYVTFLNPGSISSNTEITTTYEYMPFGGKYQNNIFGARGEYELIEKKLTLGSTFLYNASQTPTDIPDVRSTPSSLSLIDADMKLNLNPEDFSWSLPWMGSIRVPLTLQITGEGAYSQYNANTYNKSGENGVGMVDGMESSDNVVSLPADNNSWFPSSAPMHPLISGLDTSEPSNRSFIKLSDVYDYGRTRINDNDKKHMLQWSYSNMTNQTWDGFVYPVASSGTSLHDYKYLEISANTDHDVVLVVDVGIVSEDSNGNGRLNFEGDRQHLAGGDDIGIGQYIESLNANNQPNIKADSSGPWGVYSNSASNYPDYSSNNDRARHYWGGYNGKLNNEDLDSNDQLDTVESFYQYKIVLHPGFTLYKIPLTTMDGSSGTNAGTSRPTSDTTNQLFLAMVKHVRFWVTGTSSSPTSGTITFETMQFTGNKWQVKVASGTVDMNGVSVTEASANSLNATTISQETDPYVDAQHPGYIPNPYFYTYDSTKKDEELKSERALKIEYKLDKNAMIDPRAGGNTMPAYYVTRTLGTSSTSGAYDFSGYTYFNFDVFRQIVDANSPGKQIFVRIGTNSSNFYEYRVNLDEAPHGSWHTFRIDLNDSTRWANFQKGTIPSLSQVQEITIGIWNPNVSMTKEEIWINNLRVVNPKAKQGGAYVVSGNAKVSDIMSVTSSYRDVSSDFMTIDETPKGKQHQIQSQVNGAFTKLPFMPITFSWNRKAAFTDAIHRNDPSYSSNYSLADTSQETFAGDISYSQIQGLDISLNAQKIYKDTSYIQQLSTPNSQEWTGSLCPSISYTLPERIFNIPLGTSTFTGKMTYTDDHVIYDAEGTSKLGRTDIWDHWKHTIDENYTYQGNYRPIGFLSFAPNFTYSQSRERGFLSLYRYYADLNPAYNPSNPHYFSDVFKTSKANKVAGLNVNLMTLPVIAPTFSYNARNTRDYVQDTLEISKDFEGRSNITFGDVLGWSQCPQFTFDHKYTESATFKNETAGVDNIGGLGFRDLWEVEILNYKKTTLDSQSYLNSKNMTETLSTNINLIPNVDLSPQYTTSWVRRMNSPGNFNTTETMSVGTGLLWSKVPSFSWLAFQSLNVHYQFSRNKSFDTNSVESARNTNHNTTLTLPVRFSDDLNGSVNVTTDNTVRLSGTALNVKYYENQYCGDLTLNYKMHMTDPIRLPNFWPFYGALIKIEQVLLLTNKLSASMVRNTAENVSGADKSTDTWTNETTLNYSLWKNVEGDLKVTNQYFRDYLNINKDYWAISLKLGLSAVF